MKSQQLHYYEEMKGEIGEKAAVVIVSCFEEMRQDMRGMFAEQHVRNRELFASREDLAVLRTEFANLRTELKGDIAVLRTDFANLRTELKGDIAASESRMTWKIFIFWTGQSALIVGLLIKLIMK